MTEEVREQKSEVGQKRHVTVTCQFCLSLNSVELDRVNERPRCGECDRPILLDRPVKVTDDDFDRVISGADVPVMVDFYADWCGPCKMMAPVFEQAAAELEPDYRLVKVNTEAEQGLAAQYAIRSIPTLAIFRQGRETARQPGAMPLPQLVEWIKRAA